MNSNDSTQPYAPKEPDDSSDAAWDAGMAAAFGDGATGSHHPAVDAETGTILAGKYRLSERIGEGGMGSVWVAYQSEPVKRKVAVKLIKAGMDSKSVLARFEAERQALAVMDHPNIAKVLDGGLHEGKPFFVMELVKGVPITEYCDANKLTPQQRLELFVPVCQAIQHAHQKGIIHRDIKPSNVLVALYDDKPVPKVIDFGIAKATGASLTEQTIETAFGGVVGTPQYMSPEQASLNNLDIDTRSDVYSLGVLLYELLTGSPPFARKELQKAGLLEILRVVREEEPPRPSTKLSTADALPSLSANRGTEPKKLTGILRNELDWIVMKALEKDRSRRYETANSFAADVLRYLAGEAVQAHPPSSAYRLKKFVRRNKVQVTAVGMVFATLLLGLAGTAAGLMEARAQASAAQRATESEREAKDEAIRKRIEADTNLAYSNRANEVLASVLGALDPAKAAASRRPLQEVLREHLKTAAKQLEEAGIGDPMTVARMQNRLGSSLVGLGEYESSIVELTKALETCKRLRGSDDPLSLRFANNLGVAYRAAGRNDEAVRILAEVHRLAIERLGRDASDTLDWGGNLAAIYLDLGRLEEATLLFEEGLRRRRALFDGRHEDTLRAINNLASVYYQNGLLDRALPLMEEAYRTRRELLAVDHPDLSSSMSNLAMVYQDVGRFDDARELFEGALTRQRSRQGPDHPATLTTMNNLAGLYMATGEHDKAIQLSEEVVRLRKLRLPVSHPDIQIALINLGEAYLNANRPDDAARIFDEFFAQKRREGVAGESQLFGTLTSAGSAFLKRGQWTVAERYLRETFNAGEKAGHSGWNHFHKMSMLGGALLGQKKYDEAGPLLVRGYVGLAKQESLIPATAKMRLPEALDRLIELYTATNKPDDVKKWTAERAKHKEIAPMPAKKK